MTQVKDIIYDIHKMTLHKEGEAWHYYKMFLWWQRMIIAPHLATVVLKLSIIHKHP